MSDLIDLQALGLVVVLSLLFGAGVPALFAVGVRTLAGGDGRPSPARTVVGWACFAACVALVLRAVVVLVTGGESRADRAPSAGASSGCDDVITCVLDQAPLPSDVARVSGVLASVGWPLADVVEPDDR